MKSRITPEQEKDIRNAYKSGGITQNALATQYQICQQRISHIIRKKKVSRVKHKGN